MEKKLQRIPYEGAVAGVCAGLGAYFGIDKTWVRVAFIVSVFFSGYMGIGLLGPIVYIVLWIVLPIKSFMLPDDPFNVDYRTHQAKTDADFGGYAANKWNNTGASNASQTGVSTGRYVAGGILVLLGIFFLLFQLNIYYWRDFARLWPVFIIILGIVTVFSAFRQGKKSTPLSVDDADEQPTEDEMDDPTDNGNTDHGYTK